VHALATKERASILLMDFPGTHSHALGPILAPGDLRSGMRRDWDGDRFMLLLGNEILKRPIRDESEFGETLTPAAVAMTREPEHQPP
jgi:hypothetical protein